MEFKKKRVVTPEKALEKLMKLTSVAEKSSGDARRLLKRWEISQEDADKIVDRLCQDRYIDDSRYCAAYIREKSRFSGWGVRKIEQSLMLKGIDRTIIQNSLNEIVSKDDMKLKLRELLSKKLKEVEKKESDRYKIRDKLFRFAASRGFEFDIVLSEIERLLGC